MPGSCTSEPASLSSSSSAYKWPLLTKALFSHDEGLSINHHACTMRVGDFKLTIRNYKPRSPHDVFLFRCIIPVIEQTDHLLVSNRPWIRTSALSVFWGLGIKGLFWNRGLGSLRWVYLGFRFTSVFHEAVALLRSSRPIRDKAWLSHLT
uniref:SFRICE_028850 n=1 Tax=Spodoptera frugiperda TaxID=7108 RepID=A0A2H1WSN8_SPOFR